MNSRQHRFSIPLILALCLSFTGSALADTEAAMQFVKERQGQVRKILKRKAVNAQQIKARNKELDAALESLLDFQELSKRALRDHWEKLTPAQRDKFVSLLRQLVQRNYQQNLEGTLDFKVRYDGEATAKDGAVVHTVARSKKNRRSPELAIDYTLIQKGGAWKVYDIVTDGASLVRNYRSQFNRIIRRDGWDSLIARMQKSIDNPDGSI